MCYEEFQRLHKINTTKKLVTSKYSLVLLESIATCFHASKTSLAIERSMTERTFFINTANKNIRMIKFSKSYSSD